MIIQIKYQNSKPTEYYIKSVIDLIRKIIKDKPDIKIIIQNIKLHNTLINHYQMSLTRKFMYLSDYIQENDKNDILEYKDDILLIRYEQKIKTSITSEEMRNVREYYSFRKDDKKMKRAVDDVVIYGNKIYPKYGNIDDKFRVIVYLDKNDMISKRDVVVFYRMSDSGIKSIDLFYSVFTDGTLYFIDTQKVERKGKFGVVDMFSQNMNRKRYSSQPWYMISDKNDNNPYGLITHDNIIFSVIQRERLPFYLDTPVYSSINGQPVFISGNILHY